MESTVLGALIGAGGALSGTALTAFAHRATSRRDRILEAKVRAFGECSTNLYEYHRATFNRAIARVRARPDEDRDPLRQIA